MIINYPDPSVEVAPVAKPASKGILVPPYAYETNGPFPIPEIQRQLQIAIPEWNIRVDPFSTDATGGTLICINAIHQGNAWSWQSSPYLRPYSQPTLNSLIGWISSDLPNHCRGH